MMLTHEEQIRQGQRLIATATKWAEAKGFGLEKVLYVKTLVAAVSAVRDGGPSMLSFDEMRELNEFLAKGEGTI